MHLANLEASTRTVGKYKHDYRCSIEAFFEITIILGITSYSYFDTLENFRTNREHRILGSLEKISRIKSA